MRTRDEVESFLVQLEIPFDRIDDGWIVTDEESHLEKLVIYLADKTLNFRLKLFDLPDPAPAELLRRLLELNASELLHGAFGIESGSVVLVETLELENLDMNELRASIDAIGLAVTTQHDALASLVPGRASN